ncbi:hypothetical protein KEJ26_06525 [Candidatus Bathyarchaeota archaeon]|nr:hypothetical protein [Candidatus Bathyarchaeota archaeon]
MSNKEKERHYQENRVHKLLDGLISDGLLELKPTFDPTYGFRYNYVEKILQETPLDIVKFLETLSQVGILKKKLYDKIIRCPSCRSPNVAIRYLCPHCNSFNIIKKALLEHTQCGGIDTEEHFAAQGKLICPICHMELREGEYRRIGTWFECTDCKGRFDEPSITQFCRNCLNQFTVRDAVLEDIYSYTLTEEAEREAKRSIFMLAPLRNFLIESGYTVEAPGSVIGRSGTAHQFSMVASKPQDVASKGSVVIDVVTSDTIADERPVIAMFAKTIDISISQPILIISPEIKDRGKQLAVTYKITVIEAKNSAEAIEKLRKIIT